MIDFRDVFPFNLFPLAIFLSLDSDLGFLCGDRFYYVFHSNLLFIYLFLAIHRGRMVMVYL